MELTTVVIRNEDGDTRAEAFVGHVDKEAAIKQVKEMLAKEFMEDGPFTDNVDMMAFVEEFYTFSAHHVIGSKLDA